MDRQEKQGLCLAFGTKWSENFKQDQNHVNVSMNLCSFNRMHTLEIKWHKGRQNILKWEIVRVRFWNFALLFWVSPLETLTWEVTDRGGKISLLITSVVFLYHLRNYAILRSTDFHPFFRKHNLCLFGGRYSFRVQEHLELSQE